MEIKKFRQKDRSGSSDDTIQKQKVEDLNTDS